MEGWCRGMMMTWGIRTLEWVCILSRVRVRDEGVGLQCLASVLSAVVWMSTREQRGNPESGENGCIEWGCRKVLKPTVLLIILHESQSLWVAPSSVVSTVQSQVFQTAFWSRGWSGHRSLVQQSERKLHCCILWGNRVRGSMDRVNTEKFDLKG